MHYSYYPQYLYYLKKTSIRPTYRVPREYRQYSGQTLPGSLVFPQRSYLPVPSESLETLIHNTGTKGQDVTDLIMQDKLKILGTAAALLRSQIDERSKIMDTNIATIEGNIMKCESYLLNLEIWPVFANPLVEAKRANLYHEISNLDSLKLRETANCWGDQVRLYSELLKTLGEYQAAARRFQLLDGDNF